MGLGLQGRERGLDGGQYDPVDGYHLLTLVWGVGGRGKGGGGGPFLYVLSGGVRLSGSRSRTRGGSRLVDYKRVIKVYWKVYEFLA